MCNALYFSALFRVASGAKPPEEDAVVASSSDNAAQGSAVTSLEDEAGDDPILAAEKQSSFSVLKGSYALSLASVVCALAVLTQPLTLRTLSLTTGALLTSSMVFALLVLVQQHLEAPEYTTRVSLRAAPDV